MSLCQLLFCLIQLACVFGIAVDNDVQGIPRVFCFQNGLKVTFTTKNPLSGHLYVKGMYGNPRCNKQFFANSTESTLSASYDDCIHQLNRMTSPPGMQFMVELVIQFHPYFTTKVDRGFQVTCLYREGSNTVTQNQNLQGNVNLPEGATGAIPVTQIGYSPQMPRCKYTIHKESANGPLISYARIGEKVFHKWQCYPGPDGDFNGILVHSCMARDGHGNSITLLDKKGCTIDIYAMQTPMYTSNLTMAFVEVHAFKFADDLQISFSCAITMCLRMNNRCNGITPPVCTTGGNTGATVSGLPVITQTVPGNEGYTSGATPAVSGGGYSPPPPAQLSSVQPPIATQSPSATDGLPPPSYDGTTAASQLPASPSPQPIPPTSDGRFFDSFLKSIEPGELQKLTPELKEQLLRAKGQLLGVDGDILASSQLPPALLPVWTPATTLPQVVGVFQDGIVGTPGNFGSSSTAGSKVPDGLLSSLENSLNERAKQRHAALNVSASVVSWDVNSLHGSANATRGSTVAKSPVEKSNETEVASGWGYINLEASLNGQVDFDNSSGRQPVRRDLPTDRHYVSTATVGRRKNLSTAHADPGEYHVNVATDSFVVLEDKKGNLAEFWDNETLQLTRETYAVDSVCLSTFAFAQIVITLVVVVITAIILALFIQKRNMRSKLY